MRATVVDRTRAGRVRIVVRIDRLLIGAALAGRDPAVLAHALSRELTGLLAQPDTARALARLEQHVAHLDAGWLDTLRDAAPARIGARAAQAIARRLCARIHAARVAPPDTVATAQAPRSRETTR